MLRRAVTLFALALVLTAGPSALADEPESPAFEQHIKPLVITLSDDGDQWIRVINWVQVWTRAMELNPGSTVQGNDADWAFDVGLRRARLLLLGQLGPRLKTMFHFGMNNQTFTSSKHPQIYVHDAWTEVEAIPKHLSLGAGLIYWNGVSRMSNASTISMLGLDAPILNWFQIEKTDQFARQLGLYAKGKIDLFDYRLALLRPFATGSTLEEGKPVDFRPNANTVALAGYFQFQLGDIESNALPYTTGTYLGAKSVFNFGFGFHWQPDALGRVVNGEEERSDLLALGADLFLDRPVGDGAMTAYLGYYHYDFGPDYTRNIGIMNVAGGGTSFNGAGNAYPVIGTGEHLYAQWGYLFPGSGVRLQPYLTGQLSFMEGLADPMMVFEVGANLLLSGHNAKVTLNYRSRPVYQLDGTDVAADSRASELILQLSFAR